MAERASPRIQPTTGTQPVNHVVVWTDIKANSVPSSILRIHRSSHTATLNKFNGTRGSKRSQKVNKTLYKTVTSPFFVSQETLPVGGTTDHRITKTRNLPGTTAKTTVGRSLANCRELKKQNTRLIRMGRRMSNSRLCQRVESIPKAWNIRLTSQISASTDMDLIQILIWDLYTNIQNDFGKKMCRKIHPDLHGTLEKNPIRTHILAPQVWWKYKDDIFMIWQQPLEEFYSFVEAINYVH